MWTEGRLLASSLHKKNNDSLRIAVTGRGSIHQGNAHQRVIQ